MRSDNTYESILNKSGSKGEPQLFSGIGLPRKGTVADTFGVRSDIEIIRDSIEMILMTGRGERVMRPTYGADVGFYVFEPSDELLAITLKTAILESLTQYEDRIRLGKVDIFLDEEAVYISISMSMPRSYGYEDASMTIPMKRDKLFR